MQPEILQINEQHTESKMTMQLRFYPINETSAQRVPKAHLKTLSIITRDRSCDCGVGSDD